MEKKPEAVATLTAEQLARFNAWQKEEEVVEAAAREAMRALMFTIRADKMRSIAESKAMWDDFEKAHKLDNTKCYGVHVKTGDITIHEPSGLALLLGTGNVALGDNNDESGPTRH